MGDRQRFQGGPVLDRRCVGWVFTINNPVEPLNEPPINFDSWRNPPTYGSYQFEVSESGTRHIQGYLVWDNKKIRGSTISKEFDKCMRTVARPDGCKPYLHNRLGTHSEVYFSK